MKRYEYKIVRLPRKLEDGDPEEHQLQEVVLDEHGEQGWRVASLFQDETGYLVALFEKEREVKDKKYTYVRRD